jgi:hypothetical protein
MLLPGTSLLAAGELSNGQARKALEQILGAPEFGRANLIVQAEDLVRRLLDKISLHGVHVAMGGIAAWLLALIILVGLAGLILIIYLVRLVVPFWNVLIPDVREKKGAGTATAQHTPAGILAEAEKKASEGDFRGALRDIYLALLLELGNRRLLTCGAAKTNSEYLREISQKAADLEELFRALVNLFEFKWYGLENCDEEDFQTGRKLYAALLRGGAHV